MIARGRDPLAYLAVRAPLVVVGQALELEVLPLGDLVVVTVPDMDAEVLTADVDTLLTFFGKERFSREFDPEKFSFHDLHFETIL